MVASPGSTSSIPSAGAACATRSRSRAYFAIGKRWPGGKGSTKWSQYQAFTALDQGRGPLP